MRRLIPLLALLATACGDGGGSITGNDDASLSGMVTDQASGAPVAGATITLGTRQATSAADGSFTISGAPAGAAVALQASAPGYETFSLSLSLQSGANTQPIALVRRTLYETGSFAMYLAPGVSTYRGVLFALMGGTVDGRPLLRNELSYYTQFPLSGDAGVYRTQLLQFAAAQQFAIVTTHFTTTEMNVPQTYTQMLNVLPQFASLSGHAELANAPLLLQGHSFGGCVAYGFTRVHASRVLGFSSSKGACHVEDGQAARNVPGYLFIGELDTEVSANNITATFEYNRSRGAPWALAIERGTRHHQLTNLGMLFRWLAAAANARLPEAGGSMLRTVDPAAGWLGDRASFAIASYACFGDGAAAASWLPSQATALEWQQMTSAGTVETVLSCGP